MREHQLKVTLSDDELARLDELRRSRDVPAGVPPPVAARAAGRDEIATRDEALSILTSLAGDGRVAGGHRA